MRRWDWAQNKPHPIAGWTAEALAAYLSECRRNGFQDVNLHEVGTPCVTLFHADTHFGTAFVASLGMCLYLLTSR
jgi:hypothetical protein